MEKSLWGTQDLQLSSSSFNHQTCCHYVALEVASGSDFRLRLHTVALSAVQQGVQVSVESHWLSSAASLGIIILSTSRRDAFCPEFFLLGRFHSPAKLFSSSSQPRVASLEMVTQHVGRVPCSCSAVQKVSLLTSSLRYGVGVSSRPRPLCLRPIQK